MLYILYGSDSFSRSEALRALKREMDTDGSLESNTAEFEASQAAPAEVLVSETVRSLAQTSAGMRFEDRGRRRLKGVAEPARVWAVIQGEAP